MARGWDSKAVEEQIEAHADTQTPKQANAGEDAARKRERQNIDLARKRLQARLAASENPAYQKLLRDALAELDARLARLA